MLKRMSNEKEEKKRVVVSTPPRRHGYRSFYKVEKLLEEKRAEKRRKHGQTRL